MKNISYFLLFLIISSCTQKPLSENLISHNDDVIEKELRIIDKKVALNPGRYWNIYKRTKEINDSYIKLIESIEKSENCLLLLEEHLELLNFNNLETIDFNYENNILLKYQIQNLTIEKIKNILWQREKTLYFANLTLFESKKINDSIQIYPVLFDTTDCIGIRIGKLHPTNDEFFDSFITPSYFNYPYLNVSKQDLLNLGIKDTLEGLIYKVSNQASLDTIRFKFKI